MNNRILAAAQPFPAFTATIHVALFAARAEKGDQNNQAYAGIDDDSTWQKSPDHHELPLAHLFVTILKRVGIETNEFAGYKGGLDRI